MRRGLDVSLERCFLLAGRAVFKYRSASVRRGRIRRLLARIERRSVQAHARSLRHVKAEDWRVSDRHRSSGAAVSGLEQFTPTGHLRVVGILDLQPGRRDAVALVPPACPFRHDATKIARAGRSKQRGTRAARGDRHRAVPSQRTRGAGGAPPGDRAPDAPGRSMVRERVASMPAAGR
jgi:hypothetical protein